jgi:hypothetical protein
MELLKYGIAVVIGGGLTLLSNYILEDRRLKNEKLKFRLDKMITVGEKYYKMSSYSLIYYTSLIDTIDKREEFLSDGAHYFLNLIDEENKKQLDRINENNITITTASMYFDVTDSEKAVSAMLRLKAANLKMHHGHSTHDMDLYNDGEEEYVQTIKFIINQIKADQLIISSGIKGLLNMTKRK